MACHVTSASRGGHIEWQKPTTRAEGLIQKYEHGPPPMSGLHRRPARSPNLAQVKLPSPRLPLFVLCISGAL